MLEAEVFGIIMVRLICIYGRWRVAHYQHFSLLLLSQCSCFNPGLKANDSWDLCGMNVAIFFVFSDRLVLREVLDFIVFV